MQRMTSTAHWCVVTKHSLRQHCTHLWSCIATPSLHSTVPAPNLAAAAKQAQHLDNVKREIKILTRLRGTLSVVHFKGAYEDDHNIHLVMELCRRVLGAVMLGLRGRLCERGQYFLLVCLQLHACDSLVMRPRCSACRGGELVHEIGRRPYDEKTVRGQCVPCEQLFLLLLNAYLGSAQHINGLTGCRLRCGFSTLRLLMLAGGCAKHILCTPSCRWLATCAPRCTRWRSATLTASCIATSSQVAGWLAPAACILRLPIEGAARLQTRNTRFPPAESFPRPYICRQPSVCTVLPVKCAASQSPSRSTPFHPRQLHAAY